jgi:hypothetical protein
MTDVGIHTGGKPRNICWPLLRETFKYLLPNETPLMDKFLFVLHDYIFTSALAFLKQNLSLVNPFTLDDLMEVLKVMGDYADAVNEDLFFIHISAQKASVEKLMADRFESETRLAPWGDIQVKDLGFPDPSVLKNVTLSSKNLEEVRASAKEAIGQLSMNSKLILSSGEAAVMDPDFKVSVPLTQAKELRLIYYWFH